ncbi:MAG: thioredoxin family protein [Spirochaetota bacterium]
MNVRNGLDYALNLVLIGVVVYLIISGNHMMYVGLVKSWFSDGAPRQEIDWYSAYSVARIDAKQQEKHMVILATAPDWCPPCKAMEQTTLLNVSLAKRLNRRFIAVRMLDTNSEVQRFQVDSFPTLFLLSPDGEVLKKRTGFVSAAGFHSLLDAVEQHQ